ncbi:protein mono-ADP-ribosyltransferase PARP15-like [Xenia sp. Carnegie-2017]|uniref:protein mono-ADP-ribosyltransferase PARP15-like n=1 Tax=Xenia sp. Carnegie-2017 TaxID=2897299 RepID=UPI001F041706|nr:protein mono-ADP-ribosyltransferase PARP15-like [Xenia sp. Carnegie-2017]
MGTDFPLPSSWSPLTSSQVISLIELRRSSSEYLEIKNHFVAHGGKAGQINMIQSMQNPGLYCLYQAFKKKMRGDVNEMRLFHGTNSDKVQSINTNDFSRNFAGVNGVIYGNGVYFARDASFSLDYSREQCSAGSQPKIYIAKVLVGKYTLGKKGLKAPPSKNDPSNPALLYDSIVNDINNPCIYVIFQDNRYYPEYLITINNQQNRSSYI